MEALDGEQMGRVYILSKITPFLANFSRLGVGMFGLFQETSFIPKKE